MRIVTRQEGILRILANEHCEGDRYISVNPGADFTQIHIELMFELYSDIGWCSNGKFNLFDTQIWSRKYF